MLGQMSHDYILEERGERQEAEFPSSGRMKNNGLQTQQGYGGSFYICEDPRSTAITSQATKDNELGKASGVPFHTTMFSVLSHSNECLTLFQVAK